MPQKTQKDIRLSRSAETYFKNGDTEEFLNEAWDWAWKIGQYRYGLDEDGCGEIVFRLVKDAKHILDLFKEGEYPNFPAFLTTYVKHLILNQIKKNSRRIRMEFTSEFFNDDRFKNPEEEDFIGEILNQKDITSFLVRDALSRLDPLASLVVKMKHKIQMNLAEIRILSQRLKQKEFDLRTYFTEDEAEERKRRIQRKEATDRLQELYQTLNISDFIDHRKWKHTRVVWVNRRNSIPEEKSFRKIGFYLGATEHVVRRLYYSSIASIRNKESFRRIDFREVA